MKMTTISEGIRKMTAAVERIVSPREPRSIQTLPTCGLHAIQGAALGHRRFLTGLHHLERHNVAASRAHDGIVMPSRWQFHRGDLPA